MRYRILTKDGADITAETNILLYPDKGFVILTQNGSVMGKVDHTVLFYPTASDDLHYDDQGGAHDSGTGTSPEGTYCGECSNVSCKFCEVWTAKKTAEKGGISRVDKTERI